MGLTKKQRNRYNSLNNKFFGGGSIDPTITGREFNELLRLGKKRKRR